MNNLKLNYSTIVCLILTLLIISCMGQLSAAQAGNHQASKSTTWNIETIDSGPVGTLSSIVIDSADNPHIAYYTNRYDNTDTLRYASWTGTEWDIVDVDLTGTAMFTPTLLMDENGYPHIAYSTQIRTSTGLIHSIKYASWTGTQWQISTVDSCISGYSLVLDSNGDPHICYSASMNTIDYASLTDSGWQTETIAQILPTYVMFPSLAIDSNNSPHVFYTPNDQNLIYATKNGETWTTTTIDSQAYMLSMSSAVLDSNDYPHICYRYNPYNDENWYLRYGYWDGTDWVFETISDASVKQTCYAIALDSKDNPHITDYPYDGLKYYTRTDSGWNIEVIDDAPMKAGAMFLALDALDYAHISYYYDPDSFLPQFGPEPGVLKYASETYQIQKNDKVSGGGKLELSNQEKAAFSFNVVTKTKSATLNGKLNFEDKSNQIAIKSININSLSLSEDGTKAVFKGTCTINNAGNYAFSVYIEDNGEPGVNDVFKLSLNNGYSVFGTINNGNIQVLSKA